VVDRYFTGPDHAWGDDLGTVSFGPDTLHDLRSVTKSIVGLLYGIALAEGQVPPLEAPIYAAFPEYTDLAADPARRAITIGHALGMSMGLQWDEMSWPYTDPRNSEIAMELAPDRYRFVLEQPAVEPPGGRWIYSGGAVALIGAVLARGTGKSLTDYAAKRLFAPLGIANFGWASGRDGVLSAASGLRLGALDLLKIGAMLADNGRWQGRQVVPPGWLAASWHPSLVSFDGIDYGRLWYLGSTRVPAFDAPQRFAAGFGNGGQRLFVMPSAGLAYVVFSGAHDQMDAWMTPPRIWWEIILPNLRER
jgi:CubicO group peptidase (beta-lactamase class C family)